MLSSFTRPKKSATAYSKISGKLILYLLFSLLTFYSYQLCPHHPFNVDSTPPSGVRNNFRMEILKM